MRNHGLYDMQVIPAAHFTNLIGYSPRDGADNNVRRRGALLNHRVLVDSSIASEFPMHYQNISDEDGREATQFLFVNSSVCRSWFSLTRLAPVTIHKTAVGE